MRWLFRYTFVCVFLSVMISCGGGSSDSSGSGSSPVLSNLSYSPTQVDFGSGNVSVFISVDFYDVDADIIGYNAVDSHGNDFSKALDTNNTTEGTFVVTDFSLSTAAAGDYSVTFFAIDSAGNHSNKLTMNFQILLAVDAGADKVMTTGSTTSLESSQVIDISGDLVDYEWVFLKKPQSSNTTIANNLAFNPSFYSDADGVYEITVTISDDLGNSDSDTINVTSIPPDFITLGSHKDDVIRVQGIPQEIYDSPDKWYYGILTSFTFDRDDRVYEWNNYDGSLIVQ